MWFLTRVIYDNFKGKDANGLSNRTGIQLLGVVLANGLCPFDDCFDVDRERWCGGCHNFLFLISFCLYFEQFL